MGGKTVKRIISLLLTLSFIISTLISFPVYVNANNNSAVYSGTATSWGYTENIVLTISSVDAETATFTGNFDLSGPYNYSSAITGNISVSLESGMEIHTIAFSINFYNTTFNLQINNNTGECTGTSGGTAHFENIRLTGVPKASLLSYSAKYNTPVESLYNECLKYSVDVYDSDFINEYSSIKCPEDLYNSLDENNYEDIEAANFSDKDDTNVSYTLAHKTLSNSVEKYIVVIRGTDGVEWEGNMKICPENSRGEFDTYTGNESVHNNFNNAACNLKNAVNQYITDHPSNNEIFLLITGHSRGGAVSNLLAYQYTIDNSFNGVVTAYTFATPNVVQYDSVDNMEQYGNIFNYCKNKDFVPCIPLLDGQWNYWKYGKTYIEKSSDDNVYCTKLTSIMVDDEHAPTVEDYYERKFPYNDSAIKISLYDFLQLTLASSMEMDSSIFSKVSFARSMLNWVGEGFKGLKSLSSQLRTDLFFIGINHMPQAYGRLDIDDYVSYNYTSAKTRLGEIVETLTDESQATNNVSLLSVGNIQYDENEVLKLKVFLNQTDGNSVSNVDKLNWNINDPSSWNGICFNEDGNVTSIDLEFCDLYGDLDISNFISLTSVNVSENYLASVNVNNCLNLEHIDVSDNSLSTLNINTNPNITFLDFSNNEIESIDLTNNTLISKLYCYDCELSEINISNLKNLKELNCENNNIITLSFDNNAELVKVYCALNYIDIQEGSDQLDRLQSIISRTNSEVTYYPQRIPQSAIFNSNEINVLKNIALNNSSLEWIDNNNNLIIENVQKNVLFEKFGNEYRTVAINVADSDVSGSFNLNCFDKLRELYCENTNISSVYVDECSLLEVLNCKNCDITELLLPDSFNNNELSLYYLDCEFNHIDLSNISNDLINAVSSKTEYTLDYERQKSDLSAYDAVIDFSNGLEENDYSTQSFSILSEQLELCCSYTSNYLTQEDTDKIITQLLTSINSLEPYLDLDISAPHGTFTVTYDNEPQSGNSHSLLFGTPVTLTATADEGYTFDGWYEKVTQRKFSSNSTYTFKITTNMDLEARFVRTGDVTLTFTNDTGQVVAKIDKSVSEWSDVTGIADLLPEVPYKLGHTNGRWNYTEEDVLTALQAGNDVTITPIYDDSTYEYPTVPTPTDSVPVINLYYSLDADNNIGSFTMAAGIPQDLNIEAIGIGFYYKKAASFNPSNFILNINNKMLTSRFDNTDSDGIYIVNINKFTSAYNWCARGYITYYDENNELKTVYSNQINIADRIAVT